LIAIKKGGLISAFFIFSIDNYAGISGKDHGAR